MSSQSISDELKRQLHTILQSAREIEAKVGELANGARVASMAEARVESASAEEPPNHAPRALEVFAAAASPMLSESQRRICERVINVFETGTVEGRYGAISIYHDGPGNRRQITYGRSQTTEYGNLKELVGMYADAGGTFSASLRPYVSGIGQTPLVDDATFKDLLRRAGNEDPVMRQTQDVFFDRRYFQPALRWANVNGFTRALSMLVIYDSFIHSGSILDFLRNRFAERPPASGGDEKTWIREYIDVRHAWLTNHSNPDVRPSNYRTRDLKREIANGNWDLAMLPFMANGVPVRDGLANVLTGGGGMLTAAPNSATAVYAEEAVDWSELEPPGVASGVVMAAETLAELADRVLDHPNISLATAHVSGVNDNATARQNIIDTAAGQPARRSNYGNAPGGSVELDADMLRGLLALAQTYSFSVSEICGGSHSVGSRHYRGVTADFNFINGRHVNASHPDQLAFRSRCQALGATQVLGPGNTGHSTHIHAAW